MRVEKQEIVKFENGGLQLEVPISVEEDTVWLNWNQISELFDRDIKTIGKHINNIFKEDELDSVTVIEKFATNALDVKI